MGNRTYLPKKDSDAGHVIQSIIQSGDRARIKETAKKLGYTWVKSFIAAAANAYGIQLPGKGEHLTSEDVPEAPETIINLPPIELKSYKPKKTHRGDPETQVLLLSDHHAGEITASYNEDIYKGGWTRYSIAP